MLDELRALLHGARRVLMEYSPGNAIPYVSRVDGGTLEVVRALGVEVLSSADVLASVVAAWDAADLASHERAAQALERAKDGLFAAIKSNLAAGRGLDGVRRPAAPGGLDAGRAASNSTMRPSSRSARTRATRTTRPSRTSRCRSSQATWC